MLVRAKRARPGELSKSAAHRPREQHAISGRPRRGPSAERRAFLCELAGELLIGDAFHPRRPVIDADGQLRKGYLLSQVDCATRYVPESYFAFHEDAPARRRASNKP